MMTLEAKKKTKAGGIFDWLCGRNETKKVNLLIFFQFMDSDQCFKVSVPGCTDWSQSRKKKKHEQSHGLTGVHDEPVNDIGECCHSS